MTEYSTMKVPELKKLLVDRALPVSGNKAELIKRLEESDEKPAAGAVPPAAAAEDEIDWDEDDAKVTTEPAKAAVAAGGQGPVDTPIAVPNQKIDVDPSTTSDLKVDEPATDAPAVAGTEVAKVDFTIGIGQTDAEKEAERRAARAKRFGMPAAEEDQKKVDRAKKFGADAANVVKGLDDALPERRAKRVREEKPQGGRNAKRQTPDRRTEAPKSKPVPAKRTNNILDDPIEKAKAEARAKKFGTAA